MKYRSPRAFRKVRALNKNSCLKFVLTGPPESSEKLHERYKDSIRRGYKVVDIIPCVSDQTKFRLILLETSEVLANQITYLEKQLEQKRIQLSYFKGIK